MEAKKYKNLTRELMITLEDFEATYGEAYEAIEGVKQQLDNRLNDIKISEEI